MCLSNSGGRKDNNSSRAANQIITRALRAGGQGLIPLCGLPIVSAEV